MSAARNEEALTGFQALMLACLARKKNISHLHAHFATSATAVARLAAKLAELTYSFTAHAKDIFHESVDREDLQRKLEEARAVITVSDFNKDYLQSGFRSAVRRVSRVYNGLDLKRFSFQAPTKRLPHIVAVGRLVEKKGFADLIAACAMLRERGRAFTCEIIGGGELATDLNQHITRLNLDDRIAMRGPLAPTAVIAAIQRAAVVAVPCVLGADGNRDGLPTILLEAMALGTPCVSTDVTGIPEIVHDDRTGLLVGQHQPQELATAIAQLMDNAPLRVRLAKAARELIEREFDIHSNSARMRAIIGKPNAMRRRPRAQLQEVK